MPEAFQHELQQQPTVVPPPGQPAAPPPTAGKNAFGLENLDVAVARQIVGPQEQFERTGAQSLRDIRPFTTRLSEGLRSSASGLVLAIWPV